jgi:hypothetical protein
MTAREAALAGRWYPGTAEACRREIEEMLGPTPARGATGGIVPHAGWAFSGALAGKVLQALAASTPAPELLLVFGTHMAPNSAPHISRASRFETPLGPLGADEELAAELAEALKLRDDPADSRWGGSDNTVEVQLPLIKHLMPDAALVVIGPPASKQAIEIGREAARAARRRGVPLAVVGSTDLTHYGPNYGFAPKGYGPEALTWVKAENDARMIEKMLGLDPEGVIAEASASHNACCPGAVAAAIAAAAELGAGSAELLEYATSHDVHPSDSFVGYAAVALRG